ncbi:hypothetical protein BASA81_007356 [Batrachochytrium salamandrivorans]|nr:hypothetical protein BASA81_007356 [Batrachochytrium salamandrivorans]
MTETNNSALNPLYNNELGFIEAQTKPLSLEKVENEYRTPWTNRAITILTSISTGIAFGFVMYQSGVALPSGMRGQMVFTREGMIKMWMGAALSSYFFCLVFALVAADRFTAIRKRRPWGKRGLFTSAFGAFVQGVGIAISGSACGGMTFTQMGASVPNAWLIFLGGLAGALVHGFLEPLVQERQVRDFNYTLKNRLDPGYLDLAWKVPFTKIAAGMIVLFAALIGVFEGVFPWQTDLLGLQGVRTVDTGLLNPTAAGIVVGVLQVPMFVLLGTFLGTSGGYTILVSQWLRVPLFVFRHHPERLAEVKQAFPVFYSGVNSDGYFQIVYCLAAALGGYVSRAHAPQDAGIAAGVGVGFAVVGGFLNIFGARVCSGCVCGHGVSGMSILSVNGFIVTPSMWVGAVVTGFALRAIIGDSAYYLW